MAAQCRLIMHIPRFGFAFVPTLLSVIVLVRPCPDTEPALDVPTDTASAEGTELDLSVRVPALETLDDLPRIGLEWPVL